MREGDKRKRYHVERERNSNLVCETTILSRDVTAQSALRCPGCLCGHRDNYLQDILRVSNATDPAASTFAATTDPGAQEFAATHAARTANWALPLCCWEACRIQGPAHAARILRWRWPARLVHYLRAMETGTQTTVATTSSLRVAHCTNHNLSDLSPSRN